MKKGKLTDRKHICMNCGFRGMKKNRYLKETGYCSEECETESILNINEEQEDMDD